MVLFTSVNGHEAASCPVCLNDPSPPRKEPHLFGWAKLAPESLVRHCSDDRQATGAPTLVTALSQLWNGGVVTCETRTSVLPGEGKRAEGFVRSQFSRGEVPSPPRRGSWHWNLASASLRPGEALRPERTGPVEVSRSLRPDSGEVSGVRQCGLLLP